MAYNFFQEIKTFYKFQSPENLGDQEIESLDKTFDLMETDNNFDLLKNKTFDLLITLSISWSFPIRRAIHN